MKIPIILGYQEGRRMDGGYKMAEGKKLEPGEKYLNIVLLGSLKVAAFKNRNKTKETQPDYIGSGVSVWINKKKAAETPTAEEEVLWWISSVIFFGSLCFGSYGSLGEKRMNKIEKLYFEKGWSVQQISRKTKVKESIIKKILNITNHKKMWWGNKMKSKKAKKQARRYRYKLSWSCQEKLEEFYKKWKKEMVFGKYPKKEMAYNEIIYRSIQFMDYILPTRIKNEKLELKKAEKRFEKYKKTKKYKEGMKWMKNRKRIELPSSRGK